jgi:hypothetical protein
MGYGNWSEPRYGYPMKVHVRPGSQAARAYVANMSLPGQVWRIPPPAALAPGVAAAPLEDLLFHGGKTVPQMTFQNVYIGQNSDWQASDIANIDAAILCAMQHPGLNDVMLQYFPGTNALQCSALGSFVVGAPKPARLDEPDVQALVQQLFASGQIKDQDLGTTIFNLLLPPGIVLALGNADSLNGLGGYHGSTHLAQGSRNSTLYYSANVFSDGDNGIPVFDAPWKNVVGTLVHELNEFRTDADVNDAIQMNDNNFLGWMSRRGEECGDQPIRVNSDNLLRIFQNVQDASGKTTFVQFMYSNAVHGAEGPIHQPH